MASPECPECHLPAANALGKIYCPQCGWNREEAEKQTRLLLKLLPVLVIVFDAPLIIWIFIGHAEVPVLAALGGLAIVPAILVVLVVRGKVRVGGLAAKLAPSPATDIQTSGAASHALDEKYKTLAELPRPRPVRMSRQGKMNVTVIAIALLAFAGALAAMLLMQPTAPASGTVRGTGVAPPRLFAYVLPLALLAIVAFLMKRSLAQQRWLLAQGELAMARVTKQWAARNGSGIRYEFTAPEGETFSRMTTDAARELIVGMSVPVFYDADEPKKQVALCAAFYELVLPGQD